MTNSTSEKKTASAGLDPVFAEYLRGRSAFTLLNLALKRLFDIFGAALCLVLLSPLLLATAVAVKLDSPGPVFFSQRRLGRYGREFTMYKFRTMCQDAEQMSAGLFSFNGDARITRLGNILRSTSIDELPQLVNVLLGDMSLIGPRPSVSYELGDFDSLNRRYKRRFRFKPGITGLAQVTGRNCNTWDQKVDLDNRYIDGFFRWGVLWDLVLLFRTVGYAFDHTGIVEVKPRPELDEAAAALEADRMVREAAHRLEAEDLAYQTEEGRDSSV